MREVIPLLRRWLTLPVAERLAPQVISWFVLSQLFAAVLGFLQLREAFSRLYLIQDDARLHVVWMFRFVDPELFPDDLIMDYFQSVAPQGYAALYWLAAQASIDPLITNKLLPLPLALLTTAYAFGVAFRLLPVPAAAFAATVLLNQTVSMTNGLANATPRAFAYPLILAFLYHLLGRARFMSLGIAALQGLFYPSCAVISLAILALRLVEVRTWPPRLSRDLGEYLVCAAGAGITLLVLLSYVWGSSRYGPVVSLALARGLVEFWPGGRTPFFPEDSASFWLCNSSSGIFPPAWCGGRWPLFLGAGLLLPLMLRAPTRFPLGKIARPRAVLLWEVLAASIGLFLAAHLLAFRLYLPARYTGFTLPILLALAGGIALVVGLDALLGWADVRARRWRVLAAAVVALAVGGLIFEPGVLRGLGHSPGIIEGNQPALYEFLATQPKNTMIASLVREADNIPAFARRSVLFSWEYSLPHHLGYYRQIRRRVVDLMRAQYTPDPVEVREFIERHDVDLWLLDRRAFTSDYVARRGIRSSGPRGEEIWQRLRAGRIPALARVAGPCAIFETEGLIVLDATCVLAAAAQ